MEHSFNLYHVFYEVARCRNFSTAANKLYISQPAISKSIAKLEENLNITLFHRSSRGVTLTPEGELLFKHVETAFSSINSGESMLKSIVSQGISQLSIGVSTTLCKGILLPLLKDFMDENPHIKITISCQSSYETITALRNGQIDIGLVGIPSNSDTTTSHVSYIPLKTIEDVFVATESYLMPYKNNSELLHNKDFINNVSFILLNKENISRKHADFYFSSQAIEPENIIEVNNMDLSIEFSKAGLGIAFVISEFVKEDLKNSTLQQLKLSTKIPKRQIGFAYASESPLTESMNAFIKYYKRI